MILEKEKYNLRAHTEYYNSFNEDNFPRLELFDDEISSFHMVNTNIDSLSSIHGKFNSIHFVNIEIASGELRLTDFNNCYFKNVNFKSTIFSKVTFTDCIFEGCTIESMYNIDEHEFIKFDSCYINGLDMAKAKLHPTFIDVIVNSTCGNLTINQNAIDEAKNTILTRRSAAPAPSAATKASVPTKKTSTKTKEKEQPKADDDTKKLGDTEKAAEPGSFNNRFGGIEFKKKESSEE